MTFERYLEILAEYDIRIWTKPKNLETLTEEEVRKECIDEMVEIFGREAVCTWAIITAYKYRYRCGEKDPVEQEMAKTKWYERWALHNAADWMTSAKEGIVRYFKAVHG